VCATIVYGICAGSDALIAPMLLSSVLSSTAKTKQSPMLRHNGRLSLHQAVTICSAEQLSFTVRWTEKVPVMLSHLRCASSLRMMNKIHKLHAAEEVLA
jgi:hypothetical protein